MLVLRGKRDAVMHMTEMKKAFHREVVARGIYSPQQFREAFPLGYEVPQQTMERWLRRFREPIDSFGKIPRYVNRFKIGADPEFVFAREQDCIHAHALGLKQGPAFGEDNNGRLAEIRPCPSRSALEVCASLLATLRWMSIVKAETNKYQWMAGAFQFGDGLGGHVHFGRKRPTRDEEVRALDNVMEMLLVMGVYPANEVKARRAGDARRQLYGRPGDYRLQTHGYEYRTFPSWLDSPSLAFLTLTLSKLTVHDPELVTRIASFKDRRATEAIMNIMAFYRDVDDDARLGYLMCQRGLPTHCGGDFRDRWGLPLPLYWKVKTRPSIIPMNIVPNEQDNEEMFHHLKDSKPLAFREPFPSWGPINPPDGYHMILDYTDTMQKKGLGEFIWDLCSHDSTPISIQLGQGSFAMVVPKMLIKSGMARPFENTQVIVEPGRAKNIIISSRWLAEGNANLLKRWLTSGCLPIWRAGSVKPDSINMWDGQPCIEKYSGKIVFEGGQQ